jgi:DUF1365 family protein
VRSALYVGSVMHARAGGVENLFRYPVYMTLLDLDEGPLLDRSLRLFGWNRRAVTSYHDRDHVDIRALLAAEGVGLGEDGRLEVLTNLRVLGHVFNPVSFWWCRHGDGRLAAVVAEVSNTFGERIPYVLAPTAAHHADDRHTWQTDKRLHVSPFMSMDQRYTWWFSEPAESVAVRIDVHQDDAPTFVATLVARRVELTSRSLAGALLRYPVMPAVVLARIHWQALRLRLKGAPVFHKPPFVPGKGTVRRP